MFLTQSPVDGKPMLLTPEESIQIQVGAFLYLTCVTLVTLFIVVKKIFPLNAR